MEKNTQNSGLSETEQQDLDKSAREYAKRAVSKIRVVKNAKKKDLITDVKKMYKEDEQAMREMLETDIRQEEENKSIDEQYQYDKARILKDYRGAQKALYDQYEGMIRLAGGQNEKVDTDVEVLDFSLYYYPYLKDLDPGKTYEVAKNGEGGDAEIAVLEKLVGKQELKEEDYEIIAEDILKLATKMPEEENMEDPSRVVIDMGQTAFMALAASLDAKQRTELGKVLINHGDKGARAVHKLTQVGYFTIAQSKEIFKEASASNQEKYNKYFDNTYENSYAESQQKVYQYLKKAVEYIDYAPHRNLALKYMTAFYVAVWEVGRYGLFGAIALNGLYEVKSGNYAGLVTNPVILGSTAAVAVLSDVMSDGRLSSSLFQDKDEKMRAKRQEKIDELKSSKEYGMAYHPDLSGWFTQHVEDVATGFEKVNPEKDGGKKKTITFESMGITEFPQEKGHTKQQTEQLLTKWFYYMYFDMEANTISERKEILDTLNG
ncbi:MAG: hypothetical protein ABII07_02965 [Patescibacteria group bacterium]